ncbi:MAG: patatin-like phospholipase family protein [Clostridia bacterium]|nr:patatin-like phospholipase family protein [Clostridia bacterium]
MIKTLGLALGSGGARGVAHAGFLEALEEENIKPDFISGCSMGAVVGGCYASGMTVSEIKEAILALKMWDILDVTPSVISKMSILRGRKMLNLLIKHLRVKNLQDTPIPFRCVATELYSGKLHVFHKGNAAKAISASSSIPTVFRPVKIDGKMFVDGGCLCRVPVKTVKEMGADVVVAVDVLKNTTEPVDDVHNIISMVLRVFDIMDANMTELRRETEEGLCDLLIEPEMKGMSQYVIKNLEKAYEEGYEAGKANADKIKELLK